MDTVLEQLLAKHKFNCVHCNNYLCAPVILVENQGNMCQPCYEEIISSSNAIAIENVALGIILEQVKLPCEYRAEGCDLKMKTRDYRWHTHHCVHRPFRCNIPNITDNCSWAGSLKGFITHCEKAHKNRILTSPNGCYKLIEIDEIEYGFYILKTHLGIFIVKLEKSKCLLLVSIYSVSKSTEDVRHSFNIKFVTENGEVYQKSCETVQDFKFFFIGCGKGSRCNFDLDFIRKMFGRNIKIEMNIEMKVNPNDSLELVRGKIDCAECRVLMKPTAKTCSFGYIISMSFCGLHRWKSHNDSDVYRKAVLERLMGIVRFPCLYRDDGCMLDITADSNHALICDSKVWYCVIKGCCVELSYPDLVLHLKSHDEIVMGFKNIRRKELKLIKYFRGKRVYYVFEHNLLFEFIYESKLIPLCYVHSDHCNCNTFRSGFSWAVNIIRGYDPKSYGFKVDINFGNENTRGITGITLTNSCGSYGHMGDRKPTGNQITLAIDTLESLYQGIKTLYYKIEVFSDSKLVT